MNLRLLATPLLATGLLLSTLGCSKKDDAKLAPDASGSYLLDGRTTNCTVKATVQTFTTGTPAQSNDLLTLELTTTPEPASGPEKLNLYFKKQTAQSPKAYALSDIFLTNAANPTPAKYDNIRTTLSEDAGLYSGNFEASSIVTTFTIITGSFKNVRP